jgi:colanic acid biosynthesis glycosyl transferase WcaI
MVSQWYDPEGSSAALPGVISRALAGLGHEVHVVTGFPNYPEGKVYPGYRVKPYAREHIRGITVHRSPLYASHDSRAARRAANYLTFASGAAAVALTKLPRVDAVLVHGTPATAAIPALALKALRRVPFVYHVQDLWPQTVVHSGFLGSGHSHIERALHRYCDLVYRSASTVAVIAPGMRQHIAARGVPHDKIALVPNWADEAAFRPVPKDRALAERLGIDRRFTLMYAGIFGKYQSLDVVLAAAKLLRDRDDIGFALVGGGVQEAALRSAAERDRLDNVAFVPLQPFERMADILALGDLQLISLPDLPLFRSTLPSKLQATMAAGRPILAAVAGDSAEVVDRAGAGIAVTPGSAQEMAEAVARLADSAPETVAAMGERGRAYYLANFSQAVAAERLSGLLESAAGRGPRRAT